MTPEPTERKRGFYRSRRGIVFGVCQGFADYFDLSAFWLRVIVAALFVLTGLWPAVLVYVVAALVMKKEPVVDFTDDGDREFYDSYAHSRRLALHRLKSAYDRLDHRIRRMEHRVTAPDFEWDRRLQQS